MTVLIVRQNTKSNRIEDLLTEGKQLLASQKIDSFALDASLLLAEVLGFSREGLLTHNNYKVDELQCKHYFELLERRCAGESVAYIVGRKEFWGLEFSVTPAVLVPRPDTETLVQAALNVLSIDSGYPHLSMLDLCTGSGVIAITLKHECPGLEALATDVSEEALAIARNNAETLGCEITFLHGDLYNALKQGQRFFLITANAPYVPSATIDQLSPEVKNEPRLALDGGSDGLDLIQRIITEAPLYLESGGYLILEADPSQMETITALLKSNSFSDLVLHQDLAGQNRVIVGKLS